MLISNAVAMILIIFKSCTYKYTETVKIACIIGICPKISPAALYLYQKFCKFLGQSVPAYQHFFDGSWDSVPAYHEFFTNSWDKVYPHINPIANSLTYTVKHQAKDHP